MNDCEHECVRGTVTYNMRLPETCVPVKSLTCSCMSTENTYKLYALVILVEKTWKQREEDVKEETESKWSVVCSVSDSASSCPTLRTE